jgi:hypothetical protein
MLPALKRLARAQLEHFQLPPAAKAAMRKDHLGLPVADPGNSAVENAALSWLCAAQDRSASADGGAARHFSVVTGWSTSYPETSGYIVPTLIDAGLRRGDESLLARARRMLDWLVGIQFPEGGFQGGMIGQTPVVPVTFNTGQILLGLSAGLRQWGSPYLEPTHRAAAWLADSLDPDGCWRRHPTPFAAPGEKTYETHVAWGLFEAARATGEERYRDAAARNVRWALTHQRDNGWFDQCCLADPAAPLTHTIGYVLRGVVEGYLHTSDPEMLAAARRTADGVLGALRPDGFLAGRLDQNWRGTVEWVCLTGSAQIAHSLLLLFRETGDERYRRAASALLSYVRRTVAVAGPAETCGAVRGSFPIDGAYGRFEYLNWACKFLIDAIVLENDVTKRA